MLRIATVFLALATLAVGSHAGQFIGKVVEFSYLRNPGWNHIQFLLVDASNTQKEFAIPANAQLYMGTQNYTFSDSDINRAIAILSGAQHTGSNVRVIHTVEWTRPAVQGYSAQVLPVPDIIVSLTP